MPNIYSKVKSFLTSIFTYKNRKPKLEIIKINQQIKEQIKTLKTWKPRLEYVLHRYGIHLMFVGLIVSTLAVGLSSFRFLDFKSFTGKNTLAASAFGSTASNGGNITIDKTYLTTTTPTESDNVSVSGGDTVTVRVKYDNTGNQSVTAASIKDSLPAGFTYVPGSTKNCLVPTTAETICDSGNATQKDSLFNSLIGTNGVSPTAGLYDATDTGATGTDYSATAGLLEIGKKRYLNLNFCYYLSPNSYSEYTNNPVLNQLATGTKVSNSADNNLTCGPAGGGFGSYSTNNSGLQNIDLLNKKYFNLNQCVYTAGSDSFTNIVNNPFWNAGTNSSNSPQVNFNCAPGVSGYSINSNYSAVKTLNTLGNKYINLAHCGYTFGGQYDRVGAIDNTSDTQNYANTSTSNSPTTLICGTGGNNGVYESTKSGIQNLDLLDNTRGQGYIEYKMTAPATAGVFGTNVTLAGTDSVGVKTVSDLGSANQVSVSGVGASSSSVTSSNLVSSSQLSSSVSAASSTAIQTSLTATINQAASQLDPTSTNQIKFNIVFNRPIDTTTFTKDQITLSGTSTGATVTSITQVSPNDGTSFEVLVNATGNGTVIANVNNATTTYSGSLFGRTGSRPFGITIDQFNNKYVSNNFDNNVTKITPAGVSGILGTTGLGSNPSAIITDSTGNIYTANFGTNNVTKITPAGVSSILGTTGTAPMSIGIDAANNIYTANNGSNNVTKITPAGVSSILGTTGLGTNPIAITVDSAGNIYTANASSNNVTKITPAGVSSILGTMGTAPMSIGIDAANNIYTANNGSNNVTKITPAGVSSILGTTGLGTNPIAITVDSAGNIYTANASSNNVTKITPAGVSTIIGNTESIPKSLIVDLIGDIFVVNSELPDISKFTSNNVGIKSLSNNYYLSNSTSTDNVVSITVPTGPKTLTGKIYLDLNNNGIQDPGEPDFSITNPVISGTNVFVEGVSNRNLDDSGTYSVDLNSAPNTYNISLSAPAGFSFSSSTNLGDATIVSPGVLRVVSDASRSFSFGSHGIHPDPLSTGSIEITALNYGASGISGFVYEDTNNNGIKEPGENPIPNVIITATGLRDYNTGQTVTVALKTDVNGKYTFTNYNIYNNLTLTQTQPSGYTNGKITVGTIGTVDGGAQGYIPNSPNGYCANNPGACTSLLCYDPINNILITCPIGTITPPNSITNIEFPGTTSGRSPYGQNYNFGQLLAPASTITGKIYYDTNNNGIQDANEPDFNSTTNRLPLGTTITLTDSLDATKIYYPSFNVDGTYSQNVDPGTYIVTINPAYNYNVTTSTELGDGIGANPTTLTVTTNQTKSAGKDGIRFNAPIARDDNYTAYSGESLSVTPKPIDNDSGVTISSSINLSVQTINSITTTPGADQIITLPKGTLSINSFDTYTFDSLPTDSGQITFPYTIIDNNTGLTATANININIIDPCAVPTGPPTTSATACGIIYTPLQTTINQAFTQIDPTSSGPVTFTAIFNQPIDITTFTPSDISLSGTAPGLSVASITQVPPNNGTTFEVLVNATGNGTVIVDILKKTLSNSIKSANTATDVFNDNNSTSTDNIVTIFSVIDTSTFVTVTVPPITNNPRPALIGTCEAGASVIITTYTGSSNTLSQILPAFVCNSTGTYSIAPTTTLPDGVYKATANATDLAGNTATASDNGVVDTTTFVTISVPALTNNPKPAITGTCEAGATVIITLTTGNINPALQTLNQTLPSFVCQPTGSYSVTAISNLPEGNYCGKASATDPASNTAGPVTSCGVVDTTTFVTISVPTLTNSHYPKITGTCEPGASLEIKVGSSLNPTTFSGTPEVINQVCPGNGNYLATPTVSIPNGSYIAKVVALDAAGNTASASDDGVIDDTIILTISVPQLTNDPTPNLVGNCKAGATVSINITTGTSNTFNQTLPTFTCNNTQTYTISPVANIPDGPYCANASSVDSLGNSAGPVSDCGVVDTSTFVTILVPALTNNPKPAITGTCEAGANVIIGITVGANNTTLQILPGFVCSNTQTYLVNPTIDIPQGPYCISASATDLAGNTASASGCGNIFVTINVPATTIDSTPTISGSCTPSTASGFQVPVEVTIRTGSNQNGQTGNLVEIVSTICSTTGTYTITPTLPIPTGLFTATAKATDAIGNTAIAIGIGEVVVPVASSSSSVILSSSILSSSSPVVVSSISSFSSSRLASSSSSLLASSALTSSSLSGGVIIITQSSIIPEVFDNLSDPYVCGSAITGQVVSNYGVKNVVIKLFTRRGDGSYEAEPKYIFRPILDNQGKYIIKLDYANEASFVKADYRVEYTALSNAATTKIGSYLASITNQCEQPKPTIIQDSIEIKPDGTTVRTGGSNELYFIAITLAVVFLGLGYWKLRRKTTSASEVFRE